MGLLLYLEGREAMHSEALLVEDGLAGGGALGSVAVVILLSLVRRRRRYAGCVTCS